MANVTDLLGFLGMTRHRNRELVRTREKRARKKMQTNQANPHHSSLALSDLL